MGREGKDRIGGVATIGSGSARRFRSRVAEDEIATRMRCRTKKGGDARRIWGCRRCRAACRAAARARARGNAASAGGSRTLRHSAQHARPGEKNFLRRVRLQLWARAGTRGRMGNVRRRVRSVQTTVAADSGGWGSSRGRVQVGGRRRGAIEEKRDARPGRRKSRIARARGRDPPRLRGGDAPRPSRLRTQRRNVTRARPPK